MTKVARVLLEISFLHMTSVGPNSTFLGALQSLILIERHRACWSIEASVSSSLAKRLNGPWYLLIIKIAKAQKT